MFSQTQRKNKQTKRKWQDEKEELRLVMLDGRVEGGGNLNTHVYTIHSSRRYYFSGFTS
jgi:hypothetical protein